MALTPADMDRLMDEHFRYEAEDDVEGVLATLDEHATHDIVGWPAGPSQTRDQVRQFYETLFSDLAGGKVTSTKRLYGDAFLVDESIWEGTAPGRPFGIEGRGRPLRFRLLHVMEFDNKGQIKGEQVWVDLAAIIRQLPKDDRVQES